MIIQILSFMKMTVVTEKVTVKQMKIQNTIQKIKQTQEIFLMIMKEEVLFQ